MPIDLELVDRAKNPACTLADVVNPLVDQWTKNVTDVASLVPFLSKQGMVACIQGYHNIGARVDVVNEVVNQGPRCGKIIGYTGNQKYFSFSLKIIDQNVDRVEESTGQHQSGVVRTFALLNMAGQLHDGWQNLTIQGDLEPEERRLLESHEFVCQARKNDFLSGLYLTTKIVTDILTYRTKVLRSQMEFMEEHGVTVPGSGEHPNRSYGPDVPVRIETLTAEVDSDLVGDTTVFPEPNEVSTESLIRTRAIYYKATQTLIPKLRYFTRAVEYAYLKFGEREGFDIITIKRTPWQSKTFPQCVARWRFHEVTARVSPNPEE